MPRRFCGPTSLIRVVNFRYGAIFWQAGEARYNSFNLWEQSVSVASQRCVRLGSEDLMFGPRRKSLLPHRLTAVQYFILAIFLVLAYGLWPSQVMQSDSTRCWRR